MNRVVVHKFPVTVKDPLTLEMDANGRVLEFAEQNGRLYVWALVDPDATKEHREFQLASTGYPIRGNHRYVGTAQLHGGDLVFHLFEKLAEAVPEQQTDEAEGKADAPEPKSNDDQPSSQARPLFNR